jgi:hypothetical protein
VVGAEETQCGTCSGYGYLGHTNPEIGARCEDCQGVGMVPTARAGFTESEGDVAVEGPCEPGCEYPCCSPWYGEDDDDA